MEGRLSALAGKFGGAYDLEALRLLRAFAEIGDPKRRREVINLVEKFAFPRRAAQSCRWISARPGPTR